MPFPYIDNAFDFAIATSVFTHMLPGEIEHYVSELARVIRPGGRVFATYFLDPPLEPGDVSSPRPLVEFSVKADGYRTINRKVPEFAIAFPERDVRERYERCGFSIDSMIPGSWSGRYSGAREFQDVLTARLPA